VLCHFSRQVQLVLLLSECRFLLLPSRVFLFVTKKLVNGHAFWEKEEMIENINV
jgi:hypothetical protein